MAKAKETIQMDIGDMCVLIASPHPQVIAHIQDRYHDFLSEEAPDFEIEMAFAEDADPAEYLDVPHEMLSDFIERSRAVEKRLEEPGAPSSSAVYWWGRQPSPFGESEADALAGSKPKVAHLGHKILFQRSDFAGCMDIQAGQGRNIFGKNMLPFAVESFLRICYSFLAVEHGGLLLHSAGVLRGDNGYIFPGQSGTGKSTIASLVTKHERVLSDEMVVVRIRDGQQLVYSTPFYGTNESAEQNIRADLKAAFLPIKDDEVYLKETRPAQALSKLLASVLFFGQEVALNQHLMDISAGVVAQVPFYEIHFRRDDSFWACIAERERMEVVK
ncbi:MAG: hypothetical protein JSV81_02775 [Anaerolineales bacterium]|nr:MAG: hypothetical protein JSV81_02775 [Anaerolineales bacterium]